MDELSCMSMCKVRPRHTREEEACGHCEWQLYSNWFLERLRKGRATSNVNMCQCFPIFSWAHHPTEIWETHLMTSPDKFREGVITMTYPPKTKSEFQMCLMYSIHSVMPSLSSELPGLYRLYIECLLSDNNGDWVYSSLQCSEFEIQYLCYTYLQNILHEWLTCGDI